MPSLKFGLYIANSGPAATPELIRDLADEAERRGFDGVWCNEHPIPAHEPDYAGPAGLLGPPDAVLQPDHARQVDRDARPALGRGGDPGDGGRLEPPGD